MSNIIIRIPSAFHLIDDARESHIDRIRKEWMDLEDAALDIWDEDEQTHAIDDRH